MLTPRSAPYQVDDLLRLAPQTFQKMSDGSFLLSEHVLVLPGAALRLSKPGGLTLRLASSPEGFATIVSFGGQLAFTGEQAAPVKVGSWNTAAGAIDDLTEDGRAYVRVVGGQFEAENTHFSRLGFWSGRTGGLAITGADRPETGEVGATGAAAANASTLDDVTRQPAGPLAPGQTPVGGGYDVPGLDYASARLQRVAVKNDAFGLFVSGADDIELVDSKFTDNLLGGVVLHRNVTNGVINSTVSSRNVGDGFSIDRASTGIVITASKAADNTGSGFRFTGRPLADGPSAVGSSLRQYGNNSVSNSTASGNGEYGVKVMGGVNIGILNNTIDGSGVVVQGPASRISINGNTVSDGGLHGVALLDGVTTSKVSGNVVEGSSTGVFVRDSTAAVEHNTIADAGSHGVSLIGSVGGSVLAFNRLSGTGASALDTARSDGDISRSSNDTAGWSDTTPFDAFKLLLHPMNALWAVLILVLALTAIQHHRYRGKISHPYANQLAHAQLMALPEATIDITPTDSPLMWRQSTASEPAPPDDKA